MPGAVPLDVVLDCGNVPVATVGSGAGASCDWIWLAIWLGLWPDPAIWASCEPLRIGGVVTGADVVELDVVDVVVEDDVDGLEDAVGVVRLAMTPACAGMLRLMALRLWAVWVSPDGGTLLY